MLIALSLINRLELLPRRFADGILIPDAVWQEVVVAGAHRAGAEQVRHASWLRVQSVQNRSLVRLLSVGLDQGEAEAIALADELKSGFLLLDEKDARRTARNLGLAVLGTLGLLIWAKRSGVIPCLRSELDALVGPGQFRLSQSVYAEALRLVGESR